MLETTIKVLFVVQALRFLFYYCFYIPVFMIYNKIKHGLQIENKNYRKAKRTAR
jgi:hypothetical protein